MFAIVQAGINKDIKVVLPGRRTGTSVRFVHLVMHQLFYVAAGGAAGAVLRYAAAAGVNSWVRTPLPTGTLSVNLIGCLFIGLAAGVFSTHSELPVRLQLFVITGILGGFTTFSSYSFENFEMIQKGYWDYLVFYLVASNVGGLLLAWLGFRLTGDLSAL